MAANAMMTVLRKVQRDLADQKDYMRNLHVIHQNINEKFNLMAEKFDQQQATMKTLEQQVRKNNTLLFGNESPIHFEDETTSSYVPQCGGKDGLETSEKHMESNEANQLTTLSKEAMNDMEWKGAGDNEINDGSKKPEENHQEFNIITNEMKEIKELIANFVRTERSVEETVPVTNREDLVMSSHLTMEQISQLNVDFKKMMSEMNEIKAFIKAAAATLKTSFGGISNSVPNEDSASYSSTDQNNQISDDFKQILSEVSKMKELMQSVEAKQISVDDTAAEVCHKETVQISVSYFSSDQITQLNSVMKKYQETNILPNIEFISNTKGYDNNSVIQKLQIGAYFPCRDSQAKGPRNITIRLGMRGFKRSEVIDMLITNPGWGVNDVVREGLRSTHEWIEMSKIYDLEYEPRNMQNNWR